MNDPILSELQARLRKGARHIMLARLLYRLAVTAGAVGLVALLLVGIETRLWTGVTIRTAFLYGLILPLLATAVLWLASPLLRAIGLIPAMDDGEAASIIGRRHPQVADKLSNLLDLARGRRSPAPDAFVTSAIRMLGSQIAPIKFERSADFSPATKAVRWAAIPALGLVLFAVAAPTSFLGASVRLMSPSTDYIPPMPFSLMVEPGTSRVVKGEPMEFRVVAEGDDLPSVVTLSMRRTGEIEVETTDILSNPTGEFHHRMEAVHAPFRYRVEANPVQSEWYDVDVSYRPTVRQLQLELTPPTYTNLEPRVLPPGVGDVTSIAGTRVSVRINTGGQLASSAFIHFANRDSVAMQPDGRRFEGEFTLIHQDIYSLRLTSSDGLRNPDPISYSLTVTPDLAPSIELVAPEEGADLDPSLHANVRLRLIDDFGFSSLNLHWRLAESRFDEPMDDFSTIGLPITTSRDQETSYDWDLSATTGLDIVPGDVIEFFAEVYDNDVVSGFKSARTTRRMLRLPSLADRYEALDESQDESETEIEEILEFTEQVREQFEELREDLRERQPDDWESARQLENISQAQEEIHERLDELNAQLESVAEEMDRHSLVSEETMNMYEELQRVVEEIRSPELMEALQALQEAMEQLDPSMMQEAISQFEFDEEQFRERIERALELFKQFQLQQELDEAAKRAEELAEVQESLATSTEDELTEAQQNRLAEEQLRARAEMQELEESMADIESQMEDVSSAPQEQMRALNQQAKDMRLPEQMEANAQQMQQGDMQSAQQGQRRMQQQMQSLQSSLQNLSQGMQRQRMQINAAALRAAIQDVLTLSHRQEGVRLGFDETMEGSQATRDLARQQAELLRGLAMVADSLQSIARQVPQITRAAQRLAGEALLSMEQSTPLLAEGQGAPSATHQRVAMARLNELALLLIDLLDQMMNSPPNPSGGMSMQQMTEQLQQMAQQQSQINQQIQEMLNQTQGQRLAADQLQRLQQMGMQQQLMQQQLRSMNRERDMAQQLMGDLERIAEDFEDSIEELGRGSLSRRTQQRQQDILTRLLDASRSMQERGRERQRESRRGEDIPRLSPEQLDPDRREALLRRAFLDALERGYAPDFEELIRNYFLLLQQEDNQSSDDAQRTGNNRP